MAEARLFSNYELLEQVLLHMPLRDLLLSQKINKACFDVVQPSSDIHRALFWKATDDPLHDERIEDSVSFFSGDRRFRYRFFTTGGQKWRSPILNPFMLARQINVAAPVTSMANALGEIDPEFMLYSPNYNGILGYGCSRQLPRAITLPSDTRSKMHLTQPSFGKLRMMDVKVDVRMDLEVETGITQRDLHEHGALHWMGFRYDALEEVLTGYRTLSQVHPTVLHIFGARKWKLLRRSIDEITGYEMLHLMSLDRKQLRPHVKKNGPRPRGGHVFVRVSLDSDDEIEVVSNADGEDDHETIDSDDDYVHELGDYRITSERV